jgi:hypothetical protein
MVLWASELKLRAERKFGEMLLAEPKHPGGRPAKNTGRPGQPVSMQARFGVTKTEAMDFQTVATVPSEKFEAANR